MGKALPARQKQIRAAIALAEQKDNAKAVEDAAKKLAERLGGLFGKK
jgi:hypothetical protein